MHYAQEQQMPQEIRGYVPSVGIAGQATASRTMAHRLEEAASMLAYQCERIENTLSKINGTPRPPMPAAMAEKIKVTAPLAQSLEFIEATAKRLCELAANLEQVA